MKKTFATAAALLVMFSAAFAGEKEDMDLILVKLQELLPGATPDMVQTSPVKDIYEVSFGTQIVYMSKDGKHLFRGDLIDVENRANLSEEARTVARVTALKTADEGGMFVYSPKEETKATITVFTDIDCPYCRRLHDEMAELNSLGVKVRYMLFPRTGVDSPSYHTAVSVWCADDRNHAMDLAKGGKTVETRTCENPVQEHMALGESVGVTGTPAIMLDGGVLVPGYRPAADLAALAIQQTQTAAAN